MCGVAKSGKNQRWWCEGLCVECAVPRELLACRTDPGHHPGNRSPKHDPSLQQPRVSPTDRPRVTRLHHDERRAVHQMMPSTIGRRQALSSGLHRFAGNKGAAFGGRLHQGVHHCLCFQPVHCPPEETTASQHYVSTVSPLTMHCRRVMHRLLAYSRLSRCTSQR